MEGNNKSARLSARLVIIDNVTKSITIQACSTGRSFSGRMLFKICTTHFIENSAVKLGIAWLECAVLNMILLARQARGNIASSDSIPKRGDIFAALPFSGADSGPRCKRGGTVDCAIFFGLGIRLHIRQPVLRTSAVLRVHLRIRDLGE